MMQFLFSNFLIVSIVAMLIVVTLATYLVFRYDDCPTPPENLDEIDERRHHDHLHINL